MTTVSKRFKAKMRQHYSHLYAPAVVARLSAKDKPRDRLRREPALEREPGPIWGGWWMWEPPSGAQPERVR